MATICTIYVYVFYGFRHRGIYYIQADRFSMAIVKKCLVIPKIFDDILPQPQCKKYTRSDDRVKSFFYRRA